MNKTIIRRISAILLCGILLASSAMTAAAADRSASVELTITSPASSSSPMVFAKANDNDPDQFFHFENAVPGDTLTVNIEVKNEHNQNGTVYLRADKMVDQSGKELETNENLLKKISLTIYEPGTPDRVVYSGNLSGTPNSAFENVQDLWDNAPYGINVGSISARGTLNLVAKLELDFFEIGNEFKDSEVQVLWNMRAQFADPSSSSRDDDGPSDRPDVRYPSSVDIIDEAPPLAGFDIPDEQVPLASLPKTGGSGALGFGIVALVSAVTAIGKKN